MPIVYLATNKFNGKQYAGCTNTRLLARKNNHAHEARVGKRGKFMDAIREYGADGFIWQIIESFEDIESALLHEKYLIESLELCYFGYNTRKRGWDNSNRRTLDVEQRLNLSDKVRKSIMRDPDWGEKQSRRLKDFYKTEEGLRQLAGRKQTANLLSTRIAMSISHGGCPIEVLKNGMVCAIYVTQSECAREIGTSQGNVNNCLRKPNTSIKGYQLRYSDRRL